MKKNRAKYLLEYEMAEKIKEKYSLEYRIKELLLAIKALRKAPELDELCFRVYKPGEDINSYRSDLEEEAKKYGYNLYFKPGVVGSNLGMITYAESEYWE